jgi:hypothetical protein
MKERERWTNSTLRAHLGERGFLQEGKTREWSFNRATYETEFVRGNDRLLLVEFEDGQEPQVYQHGKRVYVEEIGWRNEQIQHDKLKGD